MPNGSLLLKDVHYALRQLARVPGFTLTVVLTLALGIGAATAVFSATNAIILRYLPVPNPQQLVLLRISAQPDGSDQTGYDETTSLPEQAYEEFSRQDQVFSDVIAYVPLGAANNKIAVRFANDPEEALVDEVSGNFFSGLGVKIIRGRGFQRADEIQHAQVCILSYGYWTRRFARNPSVLNSTFYIKGVPFTAIGVTDPEFAGIERDKATDLWVPFQSNPTLKPWGTSVLDSSTFYQSPKWFFLMVVGRLKPGIAPAQAIARLDPIYHNLILQNIGEPKPNSPRSDLLGVPLRGIEGTRDRFKEPLAILLVMVGLVLLIACSNVAVLFLARNSGRRREFSLRIALGAGHKALFRQLLTESLVLVVLGGALGWIFALIFTKFLGVWSKLEVSLAPDAQVLWFALSICATASLVFGLVPLRNATNVPVGLAVRGVGAASMNERGAFRLRHIVVALQVSLCLVLLVGAGLLARTLRNLETADLGFRSSGLAVFGIAPPPAVHDDREAIRFHSALLERFRVLPGVESATIMQNRIGAGWSNNSGVMVDAVVPGSKQFAPIRWNAVGPDYFHVLDIPIFLGRDFTSADSAMSPLVVIVDQSFAKTYLQGDDAIGHHIAFADEPSKQYTIIGVVRDTKYTSVREQQLPMAYISFTQTQGVGTMHFELRSYGGTEALLSQVRRALGEIGPDLLMLQPMTQREQFQSSYNDERLFARLSIFFGILASLLVATGLYGSLAYQVTRRIPEIGVRMALGARRDQLLWMILREGLLVSAAGIFVGLPLTFMGAHLLGAMLFGLKPSDPTAFAGAIAMVFLITLTAGAVPAVRASAVDPMVALRGD